MMQPGQEKYPARKGGAVRKTGALPGKPLVNLNLKGTQMNAFFKAAKQSVQSFVRDDDGAQVVEYALIIAVVSIILVVALKNLTGASFSGFITRVGDCLTAGKTCA
jgi:pilus assembly protein Flp/PilA